MQVLSKQRALANLRARIESIEQRPALAGHGRVEGATDGEGLLSIPGGLLHEIYADAHRDAGAALGFALGLARGQVSATRPAVLFVQLTHQAQDLGVPYSPGLGSFGIDPAQIVFARMESATDLLWAIEEAIGCPSVASVIADSGSEIKALDFTASRRLSLRAAMGGSSVLLLRTGSAREATAARLRWRIQPQPSAAPPFDARAPGPSRWKVQLEKGRLGSRRDPKEWLVDWTENGFAVVTSNTGMGSGTAATVRSPLPRPLPAQMGDRLSQTG